MKGSNVSGRPTEIPHSALIADVWENIHALRHPIEVLDNAKIIQVRDNMISAVHRLQFLEMVVLGLTIKEQYDAYDYAKFIKQERRKR